MDIARAMLWLFVAVAAAAATACDLLSFECTSEARAGILVIPVDSVSRMPVTNAVI